MKKNDPAFACAASNGHQEGMALRDYIAAAAMQGICSIGQWPHSGDFPEIAKRSYAMADAMLAEREKP